MYFIFGDNEKIFGYKGLDIKVSEFLFVISVI